MITLSLTEIASLESQVGHTFPVIYRELLTNVGAGRRADGAEIYHPLTIAGAFAHHFEDAGDLFGRYFPIGCDERDQTIWLVDVDSGKVATIHHETHPDDYPDEKWLAPTRWMKSENLA